MTNPLRIAFMGSPDFSVPVAAALRDAGHEIICVYSQPPRRSGRGKQVRPTPVHAWAEAQGIEVRTPRSLKGQAEQEEFAALDLDVAVVVAYGLILPQAVLDAPHLGCMNMHASLLPRWRGAAPIQRAIMAGDTETGVQAMMMEAGLDTGPVLATAKTPIAPDETAGSLHDRLSLLAAELAPVALAGLVGGTLRPVAQSEDGATYAAKIGPEEQRIDWTRSAVDIDNQVRGLAPFPGAYCTVPASQKAPETRLKVLETRVVAPAETRTKGVSGEVSEVGLRVVCGDGGEIELVRVQKPGSTAMPADTFLRGFPITPGTVLS